VAGQHILLIEDDDRIGASLLRALSGNGYEVRWETQGEPALIDARHRPPDLVLLDLGLPDVDGLDICRTIHLDHPDVPIVILTARDEELDVVIGLDAGAVDYVSKPFKLAELLARIRAQLRRVDPRTHPEGPRVEVGDLSLDGAARRVWLHDRELDLRPKEFELLARLLDDAGNVVTREQLMAEVWDEHWHGSTKTLDFHIAMLRRKIDAPGTRSRITTVRGVGYRFERS
jgi:DNA-binding response OmpR family regulator